GQVSSLNYARREIEKKLGEPGCELFDRFCTMMLVGGRAEREYLRDSAIAMEQRAGQKRR
ncbi:MAG: hypothetical protein ABIH11_08770, partial [Candidatus Altiarchaeota archaeon]